MLPPERQGVVGIEVAKEAQVVCALAAPRGTMRHKPSRIDATADGFALRCAWLQTWGARAPILIGLAATGPLWEPLDEDLTRAGSDVLLLTPRQTASWASRLGLRAKSEGIEAIEAQTLARGRLAGWARASPLPAESVQALRTLPRARRDLSQSRTATRQRLHDDLVTRFPEFVRLLARVPGRAELGAPAVLSLLTR